MDHSPSTSNGIFGAPEQEPVRVVDTSHVSCSDSRGSGFGGSRDLEEMFPFQIVRQLLDDLSEDDRTTIIEELLVSCFRPL